MGRFFLVVAVALSSVSLAEAAQVKTPSCEAVAAWANQVRPNETYSVAPALTLPKAFADEQLVPLFGVPALGWTQEDLQSANQTLVGCYQAAAKQRDKASVDAFANANRTLQGLLPRVNAALQKAKTDATTWKTAIDGLPDSAELDRALDALLKANPATPDPNAYQGLPRPVIDPVWRLAGAVPHLAHGEREPIYKALAERRTAIQANLVRDAEAAIAAAPADAGGMLQLMELRRRVATFGDAAAKARLEQGAQDRLRQLRDELRQAKPAAWVPPECTEFYGWGGAQGATQNVALGSRMVMTALVDERTRPVFGVALADWRDEDFERFKKLRALCQAQLQAQPGGPPPNPELQQAAGRGRWIDTADQAMVEAKTAIAGYRKARETLDAVQAKVAALPDTADSLATLAQLSLDPAQNNVSQDDRARFVNAVVAKNNAIAARVVDDAMKGLAEVKVGAPADLAKLSAYAGKVSRTLPDPRGQEMFNRAFVKTMDEAASKQLPEFEAKLAAIPVNLEGIGQANTAVARLTGIEEGSRIAALRPYQDAAARRTAAIVKGVSEETCRALLASLGIGDEAKQEVWDGGKGMTLGEFICGVAANGAQVSGYTGTGLFSSTATLKLVPPRETLQTFSLHKAEVRPGSTMLVGFQVKDANQERKLSVQDWEAFANLATPQPMEIIECKRLDQSNPEKVPVVDKLFWLRCVLQAGGLAAGSR